MKTSAVAFFPECKVFVNFMNLVPIRKLYVWNSTREVGLNCASTSLPLRQAHLYSAFSFSNEIMREASYLLSKKGHLSSSV